jgi:hypothetical protein
MMAPVIHPVSNLVYVLARGNPGGGGGVDAVNSAIYKSSNPYDALSSSTTFTKIAPPTGTSELRKQYESFGIAPDGTLYLAGWQQTEKDGFNESLAIYSYKRWSELEYWHRDQYCWAWQGPTSRL